ncbi:DUF397 domain-containing protein [Streptomyces sp. AK02-01A]|uniref:DUF397 domain-containing protein n=1 Tax=Streptomyces sp. AK02-01A TaxID=3028648 RepID=UPI0029A6DAE1|nr:DUF397 domain-containing protein [Streptomyces sp. AK02-01A]MDX3852572.1 DUF397 domain-containing protein [Streptomyces sp. AK02-01A]
MTLRFISNSSDADTYGSPTLVAEHAQLAWFKSSYSGSDGGNCIEVALAPRTVHIRDSKTVHGPALRVSPERWSAFVSYARDH